MMMIILSQLKFNSIRYFGPQLSGKNAAHKQREMWWNLLQLFDTFHISCFFILFLFTTVLNCNKSMGDKSHTFIYYYLTSRISRIDFCLQAIFSFECWCFPSAISTINFCHIHFRLSVEFALILLLLVRWFTISISLWKVVACGCESNLDNFK